MGFECALAIVMPSASSGLVDFYPPQDERELAEASDDIPFETRVRKIVPAREWQVVRFIDFGRVRTLVKSSSSISVEKRAGSDPVDRAAICTASFLLDHLYELERKFLSGSIEHTIPFIADHLIYSRHLFDHDEFVYSNRFEDIFEYLGSSDVVTGLWSYREEIFSRYKHGEHIAIMQSIFWRYNCALMKGGGMTAFFGENNSLLWDSAFNVSNILSELLSDGGVSGHELRKDPRSVTFVTVWRDTLRVLSGEGARCIFLTDSFHTEARTSMRSQSRYL